MKEKIQPVRKTPDELLESHSFYPMPENRERIPQIGNIATSLVPETENESQKLGKSLKPIVAGAKTNFRSEGHSFMPDLWPPVAKNIRFVASKKTSLKNKYE